ncbi:MAG: hypothetical protein AB7I27_11445 [Bacteriovoracaceae bacterium]
MSQYFLSVISQGRLKNMMKLVITLLLLIVIKSAFALTEARLLSQSSSGNTALFNVGPQDGIREGDYGVILKEIRPQDSRDLRVVPVARARNIKVTQDSSIWILFKIDDPELLVKGDKYLVLSESTLLSGRRDPRIGKVTVITPQDKQVENTLNALSDDKDRLSKLKNNYQVIDPVHKKEERSDSDATLVDVEGWEKLHSSRHRTALYKGPNQEEFRRSLRLSTFEKLVTAYVKKVNDPNFNYDNFYQNQMRSEFSNEFRKKTNFETEYESFLHKQALKTSADAKLYRSLLEKGEGWSEDFSDEELGVVLKEVSVLQEKDRRELVMARPKRYSLIGEYGMALTDSQNSRDTKRDSLYSVNLDFEAIPFLGHETLERFTLNTALRSNKSAFQASDKNISFDEYSAALGVNWYPLMMPSTYDAPIIFLGTYVRTGTGSAKNTSGQKANYTVLAVPGFRLGLKYFLRNNFGLRIVASMETLQLERYESSTTDNTMPQRTTLVEGKVGFGLGYSF